VSPNLPPGSPEFSRLFETFEHTAYRLERLPAYAEPAEAGALAAYLAGSVPRVYPGKAAWVNLVSRAASAGLVMQRVHVVLGPLSDYLRYEIGWSYGLNVEAGEDVRILVAGDIPAEMPGDYWLFDSRTLARMNYGKGGRLASIEIVPDPEAIVEAAYWRDAALHAALPWRDYVARFPVERAT
jgi:hypothetical protein